ncbi:MAG: archaeosortase/exosortase family protein [Flavobacteriales bacterium]|nr:archaeosortase/exosortase family protein [Flavobacteriales bacterium]
MKLEWLKNPLVKSLLTAIGIYFLWYILYDRLLHPHGGLDQYVISNSISISKFYLQLFNFETFNNSRVLGITSTMGLWIGDPCNAIPLMAIFAGFIIALPGDIKKKLVFIPAGIIAIHILNTIRIAFLCLILLKAPNSLEFNHTYTFTLIIYGFIFFFWMFWVRLVKDDLEKFKQA